MSDEDIGGFVGISGSSPEVARHYLSLTDGNLEQAIQLFFDSPDLAASINNPPQVPYASRPATAQRPIVIDSDDEDGNMEDMEVDDADLDAPAHSAAARPMPATAYEDDAAMARRLQEEMYGGAGASVPDPEGVRAPIARTTETLVGPGAYGPGAYFHGDDEHEMLLEQMRRRIQAGRSGDRPGVFNQRAGSSSIWDDTDPHIRSAGLAAATGGASEQNSKAAKLAELFRPPFELMSKAAWEDARDEGKEDKKWILVNIQDPSIFDCQALNRDIWKHEGVRETIRENFIFMQYSKDDPKGNQYTQYYFQHKDDEASYPHVAVVDPRTGEQVKTWIGGPFPKAMDFLMQLHEFLDRYSLDSSVRNPVAKRKPSKPVDVDRLTEEQQLEIAMRNSMSKGKSDILRVDDPDEMTKSVGDLREEKGKGTELPTADVTDSAFSRISSSTPHVEPENGPTTTRIQFRHSSGRIIHRFSIDDLVLRIYEWLKADPIDEKVGVEFELKASGKNLIEQLEVSIADAGLKNATVMVEFIED